MCSVIKGGLAVISENVFTWFMIHFICDDFMYDPSFFYKPLNPALFLLLKLLFSGYECILILYTHMLVLCHYIFLDIGPYFVVDLIHCMLTNIELMILYGC